MAERAIFLDRDNTIIDNDGYLGDPSKVKLLPGAATALTSFRDLGYRLIVVSNQSGVARGMFKESDVEAVNDEMSRQLKKQTGAYIDASYYCPFHPTAPLAEYRSDHNWRKPKPGMLLQAAADFSLDLTQCWMVGDQPRDIAAGAAAGCRTILLRDPDHMSANGEEEKAEVTISPNFIVKSLTDAARIIVREGRHAPPPTPPTPSPAPPVTPISTPTPTAPLSPPKLTEPVAIAVGVLAPAGASSAPAVPQTGASTPPPVTSRDESVKISPPSPTPPPTPTPPAPASVSTHPTGSAAAAVSGSWEKNLDELVIQLRQQNRNADLRPDFSLAHILAIVVQAFAVIAMVIGFFKYFTMNVTYKTAADAYWTMVPHMQALIWIMAAVFLQGVVVAILVYARGIK